MVSFGLVKSFSCLKSESFLVRWKPHSSIEFRPDNEYFELQLIPSRIDEAEGFRTEIATAMRTGERSDVHQDATGAVMEIEG